jgi:glutamate 5-kinase
MNSSTFAPIPPSAAASIGLRKRIVLKFGTGILKDRTSPTIDGAQVWNLLRAVAQIRKAGHEVIVVTSGAVAAGLNILGLTERPTEMAMLQACAAVGQSRLMHFYEQVLREWDLHVGQMLVTNEDFELPQRRAHIENTLCQLLACEHVVPVLNENDSVAIEEIRFGDNDALSAGVAKLAKADLLILLTSVDGLIPPSGHGIVETVTDLADVAGFAREDKGDYSVGGMDTKLTAVRHAVEAGVETIIANGRHSEQLLDLINGGGRGTRFLVKH